MTKTLAGLLALLQPGCVLGAGVGVWSHSAGPIAVEETVGGGLGQWGGPGDHDCFGLEAGGDVGRGQRRDVAGSTLRGDLHLLAAWCLPTLRGDTRRILAVAGASFDLLKIDGYHQQAGGQLHAGLAVTWGADARWGVALEATGGLLGTAASAHDGEELLPAAFIGGVRLRAIANPLRGGWSFR